MKQANKNNIGFTRVEGKDIGVDNKGNIAQGYQHHDALWWSGNPMRHEEKTTTISEEEAIGYFNSCFSRIAQNINSYLSPANVLDLGCGSGQLAYMLREFGIDTVTVDANKDVLQSPFIDDNHFWARTDEELVFTDDNNNPLTFDLIISLEHFEHISPDTIDNLMQNIVRHSHKGTYFIFTAANWEYEDIDKKHIHCNAKDPVWWINYIGKFNFTPIPSLFNIGRAGNTAEIFSIRL